MAALVGIFFGIPSLRIKGLYLAVSTLAAQLIIEWVINHWSWLSGGAQGSIYIKPPTFPWIENGAVVTRKMESEPALLLSHLRRSRDRDRVCPQPVPLPPGARVHRRPGPRHRGRDHRHQHLRNQARRVRHRLVLCGDHRRALHLLLLDRELRELHAARLDPVPRDVHHRRARQHSRVHLRAVFITMLPIVLDFFLREVGGMVFGWDDAAASAIMPSGTSSCSADSSCSSWSSSRTDSRRCGGTSPTTSGCGPSPTCSAV